jgi:mannosyltransferase OCH1-like enzyme
MADELIKTKYPFIMKQWSAIMNTKRHDRGTRLSDVARLAIIHAEGGIYLDADFVPCADLNELVGPPGYASFPWPHLHQGRISNGIFSASPGHPLLGRALAMLSQNGDIMWFGALNAAGPHFVAKAVKSYCRNNLRNAMIINKQDKASKIWYYKPMFKLRFGRDGAMRQVNWVHLGYNSWFGSKTSGQCEKEEKVHLIRPFLENACFPKGHQLNKWYKVWRACG